MNCQEIEEVDRSINSNNLESESNPVQNENPSSIYSSNIVLFESDSQNSELPTSLEEKSRAIRGLAQPLASLYAYIDTLTKIDERFLAKLVQINADLAPLQTKLQSIMLK